MWRLIEDNANYFFAAFAIIIPLLSYAVYLQFKKLSVTKKSTTLKEEDVKRRQNDRQESLMESIRIISLATVQEQCEVSEASIRLANLIPLTSSIDKSGPEFISIFSLYQEIKNLKTHQDRNDLSTQDRLNEDKLRFEAETRHLEGVKKACEHLYELTKVEEGGPHGN